jgi:hypothetical protein
MFICKISIAFTKKKKYVMFFLYNFYDICVFFKSIIYLLSDLFGFLKKIFNFFKRLFNLNYIFNE